jgi:FtsZ-interacting cell division protein ZipA
MTDIKLIIAGVVAAVILIVSGVLWYEHHEVKTLTQANAVDSTTIAAQAQSVSDAHATVVNQAKSAAITEQTQDQAASDTAATTATVNTINSTRQSAEQQIEQAYAQIPGVVGGKTTTPIKPAPKVITVGKTTINTGTVSEATALSTVRIQSMWQTYCQLNPADANAAACTANQ